MVLMTARIILLVVYYLGEEWTPPFNLLPGGDVGGNIGREDTHVCLHSFEFMAGTRKEEVK